MQTLAVSWLQERLSLLILYAQMQEAIRALVKRAIKSGDIRKDLDPMDLIRALVGVANVTTSPDWQQSARRLVDILVTGSRPIR
jgi:hypothetical protein